MRNLVFFVLSNGEEPACPVCGARLQYRDQVPRIMRGYNGKKAYVMIERRKCQNPDCKKLHRCLPSQLTRFKHFLTEIIENTVDDIVIPEDPDDPTAEKEGATIESPSLRTVSGWKAWVEHNKANINGFLKSVGHSILGFSVQFLKSGISLLDELRSDGSGWLATVQHIIYNAGGSLEPCC
ncbi:MAG: DUF6431 domain-containing protein [Lachnospiraceae bacterium]|jgi:hypothetical protein|nr:DUF6431 domain-containing protein [Lachnospiraceae bacterium]